MSPGLSAREAAAFAAIVNHLGDPERRRFFGTALAAGSCFLAVAAVVLRFLLGWPWAAVVSFVITFVVGLATGLLLVGRRLLPRAQ